MVHFGADLSARKPRRQFFRSRATGVTFSAFCRAVRVLRGGISGGKKWKNENGRSGGIQRHNDLEVWSNKNDLEQHSKAHSKEPERWSWCSGGSTQACVPRRETGV
jgi:hypothetical protein